MIVPILCHYILLPNFDFVHIWNVIRWNIFDLFVRNCLFLVIYVDLVVVEIA